LRAFDTRVEAVLSHNILWGYNSLCKVDGQQSNIGVQT
jgi:hypothetical protein